MDEESKGSASEAESEQICCSETRTLSIYYDLAGERSNSMLIWIIEFKKDSFVYQSIFDQYFRAKTWRESGQDRTLKYFDVWTLAPRRELVRTFKPGRAFIGQTLGFI